MALERLRSFLRGGGEASPFFVLRAEARRAGAKPFHKEFYLFFGSGDQGWTEKGAEDIFIEKLSMEPRKEKIIQEEGRRVRYPREMPQKSLR
jgi:hypothetical protein